MHFSSFFNFNTKGDNFKNKVQINVKLNMEEMDLTSAESKAAYEEIEKYVLDKYDFKISNLYIAQVKRKCGIEMGKNYNISKKENLIIPRCLKDKEEAIMNALEHFQMI